MMRASLVAALLMGIPQFGICQSSNDIMVHLSGTCTDGPGMGGFPFVRVRAKGISGNVIEEATTDFDGAFRISLCRNHVVGDSLTLEVAFPTYGTEMRRLPARSQDGVLFSMLRTDTITVLGLDSVNNFLGVKYSFRGCETPADPNPLYVHCNGTIKRFIELKLEPDLDWEEWRLFLP